MNKKIIKRIYNVVIILCFIGAIGWCFSHFYHGSDVVYTDDAQVNRHITPINTRVSGFIKEIRFSDYQHVKKGDTLVIIEDSEFRLHVAQAEAGLRGSKAGSSVVSASMGTTTTNVQTASAGIEEARVDMMNAKQDFDRFAALMKKDAVTRQQYDNAYARYLGAKARYEQASSRKASAASVRNVQTQQLGGSRAGESVAEAQLNLARLNLSYTVIVATCDGVMGRKDIHEGQLVQPGQMLARIVDDNDVWVVANYRETQMDGIQVGKAVDFTADAIPGVVFHGKVEALSAAAGNAYSMIPVDNATGNFVKVEQRVPVRIALTRDNDLKQVALLRAGLNVETKVRLRIVDDNDVWVVANYRETQMDGIQVGKAVDFTADAIPGVVFHGKVEALSAAAGNAYSMIPVDNATGNFVKVEQRVPVRIALTRDNDLKQVALLRAGLNVETKVRLK